MATFENITKELAVTGSDVYLPLPINNMINREGYWYTYTPASGTPVNSNTGGEIKLYGWGAAETLLNSATSLTINGTIPLLVEAWGGSDVTYYASTIEHIGAGTNDITNTVEDNALFFAHMGAYAANDDAFYWDRLYIEESSGEWSYYQYHKHLPSFYTEYEQGRETTSGGGFLVPSDKEFGYQISLRVSSGGTPYQSRLARIHKPSVGGAHNSHNDVTLPSVGTKNYMSGGIIRGTSNKYHVFYIAADGTEWEVFSRTYTSDSQSFSAESSMGTFDLADPTFSYPSITGGDQEFWPVRTSCGDVLGSSIYFPVIMTNQTNTSNFDLEVWSFASGTPLEAGDLIRQVIISNVSSRPDAQCVTVGSTLYVAYSDATNGGVSLHSYDGSSWTNEGNVVTNDNPLRVHGFRYNSADISYYMLLSGTQSGTGINYTGPGMYSFGIGAAFAGYPHLDYDSTNHGFTAKAAQATGHVEYDIDTGYLTKYTTTEPEGIASDKRILEYAEASPQYYRVKEVSLGGVEEYEHVIELSNGIKCGVGQVSGLPIDNTASSNILVSLFDFSAEGEDVHLVAGGLGQDFTAGVVESSDGNVWLTGYTKSALVEKRDIKVHGFLRNVRDGSNVLDHQAVATDSNENYYVLGNHDDGYTFIIKYDKNFDEVWKKYFDGGSVAPVEGYDIHVDANDNIYVCGAYQGGGFPVNPNVNDTYSADSSTWTWNGTTWELTSGTGSADGFVLKLDTDGAVTWANSYGASGAQTIKGITTIVKTATTYVVFGLNNGTSCSIIVLNEDGTVSEVNNQSNLNINKVSYNESTDGRFCFAGTNGGSADRFGMAEVDASNRMIQWLGNFGTGTSNAATDIKHLSDADGNGDNAEYVVVGTIDSNSYVMLLNVDEAASVYNVQKTWARSLAGCEFNRVLVEDYTNPNWNSVTGTNPRIYVAGSTTTAGRGSSAGLVVEYDNTGSIGWQNTLSFMGAEKLFDIVDDGTKDNFVVVGSKSSHSSGLDGMLFRGWKQNGFGTGNYHIDGNPMTYMWYETSTLTDSANATSLSSISAPADSVGSYSPTNLGTTITDVGLGVENYDGSYGPNGTFQFWTGYIDLDDVQAYLNSATYLADKAAGKAYCYAPSVFNFYQVATQGDGSADDGNVFGYDIIEHSGGMMVPVGVTSGNIGRTNTGASGVYDYIIFHVNKSTGNFMYFQNGSTSDEEIYAVTELADNTIAIGGRSTGNLGSHTNIGGYDLFLGIHNMTTHTTEYYQAGSGFNDRIVGLHDIGGNQLAAIFSTSGGIGSNTNLGSEDIGVITFNYSTDVWGDTTSPEEAWQTGSGTSDLVTQNGHHSTILPDGRIAIVGHSAGFFADDNVTSGFLDSFVAILDRDSGTWKKYQTGTGSNDFTTSITSVGNKLLIGGSTEAAIEDGKHAVYWEFDASFGINGRDSSVD